jgi:hypothetical protein
MERDPNDATPDDFAPGAEKQELRTDDQPPKVHISALFGSLKHKTTVRLSLDEIDRISAEGWAGVR